MSTLEDAITYASTHPLRDVVNDDGTTRWMSWHGYCESFVSRASGTPYRASALEASRLAHIESTDVVNAPAGTFGYSSGVVIGGVDYGHVWINMGGGLALMASNRVTTRLAGGDAGLVKIAHYLSLFPAQKVIGWSWDHCGGRFTLPQPEPLPDSEEIDMSATPIAFEPGILVWPNGYANFYDRTVFDAIKAFSADPTNASVQWVRDTYIRESWAAADGIAKRQAAATAQTVLAALQGAGIDVNVTDAALSEIAEAVVSRLPKPGDPGAPVG